MSEYREILENLGYRLKDHGQYWRTNAVYRSGDNSSALQIYKDTGVWKDYVEDTMFLPFEALLQKTLNTKDSMVIKSYLREASSVNTTKEKNLLKEEKSYDKSCLKRLLPHHDFYLNKNISLNTLEKYRCGLSTSGKMYQRVVFPIFRQDGMIHGFSGRKVTVDDNKPKWLHLGRCSDWFYPFFSVNECMQSIIDSKQVIIVESIGDSLSLFDNGYKNNLVSFGLNISPKFISKLGSLGLEKIVISFNNDCNSEINRGAEASIKTIFKLIETIDFQKIYFIPPHTNDFGDMTKEDFEKFSDVYYNMSHMESMKLVMNMADKVHSKNKSFSESLKKFKKLYAFHYDDI